MIKVPIATVPWNKYYVNTPALYIILYFETIKCIGMQKRQSDVYRIENSEQKIRNKGTIQIKNIYIEENEPQKQRYEKTVVLKDHK